MSNVPITTPHKPFLPNMDATLPLSKKMPTRNQVIDVTSLMLAQPSSPDDNPVDLWGNFDPPVLPVSLLPTVIENFAIVMSKHMGADSSGLAMSALAVFAAAILDRVKLQVKVHDKNWTEEARLWVVLVGAPSTMKSPIMLAAMRQLAKMDSILVRDYLAKLKAYSALSKEEKVSHQEPLQKRYRVEDVTVEAVQEVAKGSPDGFMCFQDELSGWYGAMEKYGSSKGASADRSLWLRAYNGAPFALNRIGRGVSIIDHLSVCLLGGIQPEPIRKIVAEATDDGLLQRMIPIVLAPSTVGTDMPLPSAQEVYDFTVLMTTNARVENGNLQFDDQAQKLRAKLEADFKKLETVEFVSRQLGAHIGKLNGIFARLCIIWHVVENCNSQFVPKVIPYSVASRVAQFIERFLIPHAVCFYAGVLGLSNDHDRLQKLASYILSRKLLIVNVRDVYRGDKAMRKLKSQDILPILQQLVALNWLSEVAGPRPSSDPVFLVNPDVHKLFAARAERERVRRDEAKVVMSKYFGR